MHKLVTCFLLMCLLFIGCSENANKYQYFQKAMTFLDSGNINGAIIAFKKAIDKDQNYFEARFNLALAYIRQEKFKSAEMELLKVIRLNPFFNEAHLSLAKIYVNVGKNDEAIKEVNDYLENEDGSPLAFDLLAMAYAAKEEYNEAEKYINKSLSISSSTSRTSTKVLMANIYLSAGKVQEAEGLVKEILRADESDKKALLLLANIQNQKNQTADLIMTYKKLIQIDPDDARTLFQLGIAYVNNENILKAREVAEKLSFYRKNQLESKYLMGIVQFHEKKIDKAIASFRKVNSKADIPGSHYYTGLCYLDKGELDQAIMAFQKVIKIKPGNIQAHLLLAITYLKKGRVEYAIRQAQKVLKLDGNNAYAHNIIGSSYLVLGKSDLAIKELDKVHEIDPSIVDVYLKKGLFNLSTGNEKQAEKEFINALKNGPDILSSRIVLAQYYLKKKKYKEAIKLLNEGLQSNDKDALLLNLIGEAYIELKSLNLAQQSFEKAISYKPGFFTPYHNIAQIHIENGNKKGAIEQYERILEIDENNVPALLMIAQFLEADDKDKTALSYYVRAKNQQAPASFTSIIGYYLRHKEYDSAEVVAKEMISLMPDNEVAYQILAEIHILKGEFNESINALKNAERLNPDALRIQWALGKAYALRMDVDKALEIADKLEKTYPLNQQNYYLQAKIYELLGMKEEVVIKLQKVLDFVPNHVPSLNNLAYLYTEGYGPIDRAVELARKAKKIAPKNGKITDTLGWTLYRFGKYDESLKYLVEAAEYLPEEPTVRYHLGLAYLKKGLRTDANKQFEYALSISQDQNFAEREKIQELIKK